jgi:polyhydroxybutyrate depolymerase
LREGRRAGNITGVNPFPICLLALAAGPLPAQTPSVQRSVQVNGRTRTYRLLVPAAAKVGPAPLVLVFHGGGGKGNSMEKLTGLSAIALRESFVVAYPDAYEGNWVDGRTDFDIPARREKIDDIAFVRAMLTDIARVTATDPKRVFATGISNGAIFSHFLAAKMSDRIAAIAPVAGGIADPFHKDLAPAHPVSVFAMHGTKDPLVPFDGGNVAKSGRGKVIATEEAMRLWVERDGIEGNPETGALPNRDVGDGCTVTWKKWRGGKDGAEVWLYVQHGAGHTWPGGAQYMPKLLVGSVCRDFDASEEIWAFFKVHPKP